MFESITITTGYGSDNIDLGTLAENLIFYKKVILIGERYTLKKLLLSLPPLLLVRLMQEGRLEYYYSTDHMAVYTTNQSDGRSFHHLNSFYFDEIDYRELAEKQFITLAGRSGAARVAISKFNSLIKPIDHQSFDKEKTTELIVANHSNNYLPIKGMLKCLVPEYVYTDDIIFRIIRDEKGLFVETNLNYEIINRYYHQRIPKEHSSISSSQLLALITSAYQNLYRASLNLTELNSSPIENEIFTSTIESSIIRSNHSHDQIQKFNDFTLGTTHAIRDAVNFNKVPFIEIVKLLDKADKFREWLHQEPLNANLVNDFYKQTTEKTWVEKLPNKITRFSLFAAAGLVADITLTGGLATAAGMGAGVIDGFFLDKLLRGWTPNQFINDGLVPLIIQKK